MKALAIMSATLMLLLSSMSAYAWCGVTSEDKIPEQDIKYGTVFFGLQFVCAAHCLVFILGAK